MSNVVEFPIAGRPITESEIDKLHSEAFRDLEPMLCDCESMGKIAAQMMFAKDDGANRELVCDRSRRRNADGAQGRLLRRLAR